MNYFVCSNGAVRMDLVAAAIYDAADKELRVKMTEDGDLLLFKDISPADWAHFCDAFGQNKPIE